MTRFDPDWRVSPGQILKDWMAENGLLQRDVAHRSNLQLTHVRDILKGEATITPYVAEQLELATGVVGQVWMNLDYEYRRPFNR